jgi:hypothetical protein
MMRRIKDMSRGQKAFFAGLALIGLSSLLLYTSPATAALTRSGMAVAGEDNIEPSGVSAVTVEVDLGGPSVTVSWDVSDDDFTRQAPASSDFTSGGVFVNVNDVTGYNVWRQAGDDDPVLIAELDPGETEYVDTEVSTGVTYTYSVTVEDASGNESDAVQAEPVSLGPPPGKGSGKPAVPPGAEVRKLVTLRFDAVLPPQEAQEQFKADLLATLAALLGIPVDRIRITRLASGSLVVDFEVVDDPDDPADDVVARLDAELDADPNALADVVDGPALSLSAVNASEVDFGVVGPDDVVSETFTFTNTTQDTTALLIVTPTVSGAGFSVSPSRVEVAAGKSGSFDVSFDAADVGNINGLYEGLLTIRTNDPGNQRTLVDLAATIAGGLDVADIDLSGVSFNFGSVLVGNSKTIVLTIANDGDLDLTGTLEVEGDDVFSVSETSFVLEGGEELEVDVVFTPAQAISYSGTIIISSDDEDEPELTVALSGTGLEPGLEPILVDDEGNEILGDFDGNATVNFDDFFIFADNFGQADFDPATDLDGSGAVNFDDFFIFADNFGQAGTYIFPATATTFSATLSGDQENPAVTTSGSGSGTFSLNAGKTELTFSVTFSGLTGVTAAHFHNAAAGTNGGVVRAFSATELDATAGTISGVWTASDDQALTSALVDELEAGNIYVNIHTSANTGGEIRGQVTK